MNKLVHHTRITELPVPEPICAGLLDSYRVVEDKTGNHIILEYHALFPTQPPYVFEREGRLFEHSQGWYHPRRLRFSCIEELQIIGLYQNLCDIPQDHPARTIVDLYNWQNQGEARKFFLLFGRSTEEAEIRFYARRVTREERTGYPISYEHDWDWSPSPPMPARLVPKPYSVYQRFGGDPVLFSYQGKIYRRNLFVGGLDIQPRKRPEVHAVLNLGEYPSTWVVSRTLPPTDRWVNMGEGSRGMNIEILRREAGWVIERLQRGQRVLVHCTAGMNRSVTICCAILILLEGLTAEDALSRVRQNHPWARPDGHHWLVLKHLAAR